MKWILALTLLALPAFAEEKKVTLRGILLEELRTSHNQKDWYVPANLAVEGLTPEQAAWRDGSGNHSVGQLANHLVFWNSRNLARLKGEPPAKFDGNNDETFNSFDAKSWAATVKHLDEVLTGLEKLVETMDDARLNASASTIAHIAAHNAYHVGQIIYLRKLHGVWDPEKGVKG
jgi:uncharacterized damage-inducible protein DinB